ncbi:MAG: SRPBCC family protein [Nannocystaceae bacterium]
MNQPIQIAPVHKSIRVTAPIERAFQVFTAGIDRWWPRNHKVSAGPLAQVRLEPRVGGRWIEVDEGGAETVVATVTAWDPPRHLALRWQINARWQADPTMASEVDVTFTVDDEGGTRVDVVHAKFETMGPVDGASMRRDVDGGWVGLLGLYAALLQGEGEGEGAGPA